MAFKYVDMQMLINSSKTWNNNHFQSFGECNKIEMYYYFTIQSRLILCPLRFKHIVLLNINYCFNWRFEVLNMLDSSVFLT